MSTTFGILIPYKDYVEGRDEDEFDQPYLDVAFRSNGGYIMWKNPLAPYLSDDMRVWPIDNDCDDIITIGDLKKAIKKQDNL